MRYDIFSSKIQCNECNTIYTHKGFPVTSPECPKCKSTSYELYLTGKTINKAAEELEESFKQNDLFLLEEYKIRLTFLLFQLKALNKNSTFPFIF